MKRLRISAGLLLLASISPTLAQAQIADLFGEPTLVSDIAPGPQSSSPREFARTKTGAIFTTGDPADPITPRVLWTTDGTAGGTLSIQPEGLRLDRILTTPGEIHWLQMRDDEDRLSLWSTDGTPAGTLELARNLEVIAPRGFDADRGLFYFTANETDSPPDAEPWVSDGTAAGTHLLKDLAPGPDAASTSPFVHFRGRDYFIGPAPDAVGFGLWRTDGTSAGTVLVERGFRRVWAAGSSLYLLGVEGNNRLILYRSDGTAAGTTRLQDFGFRDIETFGTEVELFGDLGAGRVGWRIDNLEIPSSLWVTDGTPDTAKKLMDLPTFFASTPTRFGPWAYFVADDGTTGFELWRTDGTPAGTQVAVELCPGSCDGLLSIQPTVVAGDRLFLTSARDPETGFEPIISDGTPAGTVALGDICPGPCSTRPEFGLFDLPGLVLFTALDGPNSPRSLWVTDLTPEGTAAITSFPGRSLAVLPLGDSLLLGAEDGAFGDELWRLDLPDLDPLPPVGPWRSGPALPGFEVQVRISADGFSRAGVLEPDCISETLCFSGAVPGRAEVFVRVVGPKPNGRLWPTLVKFSTSTVEIWIRQLSSGDVRYYRLAGARLGFDELPGLFDREGFAP